ncbi:MAG: hypothetical protein JSW38_02870 [Dehalococcoidia bacterium]|nr:MAG: hypothetical protein JSW38_02870 [Dehalococcoidia bacterium]
MLMVTCVLIFGCSNGGDVITPLISPTSISISSPEEVVHSFLAAIDALDAEAVAQHFIRERRNDMLDRSEHIFSQVEDISISNLSTDLVSESDREAMVQANYDWTFFITSGGQRSSHRRELMDLVKENGEWLLRLVTAIPEGTPSAQGSEE